MNQLLDIVLPYTDRATAAWNSGNWEQIVTYAFAAVTFAYLAFNASKRGVAMAYSVTTGTGKAVRKTARFFVPPTPDASALCKCILQLLEHPNLGFIDDDNILTGGVKLLSGPLCVETYKDGRVKGVTIDNANPYERLMNHDIARIESRVKEMVEHYHKDKETAALNKMIGNCNGYLGKSAPSLADCNTDLLRKLQEASAFDRNYILPVGTRVECVDASAPATKCPVAHKKKTA